MIKSIRVPVEVILNDMLPPTTVRLFVIINEINKANGKCIIANYKLAAQLKITRDAVRKSIIRLMEYGYVKRVFDINTNRRSLLIDESYHKRYEHLVNQFNNLELKK